MKASLLSLDGSIMSFIKNPIFKNSGVVDVEQAGKASRDLETIIELSNLINKDAQRENPLILFKAKKAKVSKKIGAGLIIPPRFEFHQGSRPGEG